MRLRTRKVAKYRNRITIVDGIRFHSAKEARRYGELKLLVKAGKITHLLRQVPFMCQVNGVVVCKYLADFQYYDKAGARHIEDAKGMRTPLYALKKKMVEAQHNVRIEEV